MYIALLEGMQIQFFFWCDEYLMDTIADIFRVRFPLEVSIYLSNYYEYLENEDRSCQVLTGISFV